MPRIAARDTAPRRKLKMIEAITRRLDNLPRDAVDRVLTWMDSLIDGNTADAEMLAMKAIAAQFDGAEPDVRESVVRWLNEEYAHQRDEEERETDSGEGEGDEVYPQE